MKWFGVIMTVMVATQQSQAAIDPMTATAVIGSVIESGGKLADLMKKLHDMFLKPITDQVDAEIKRVDTDIDGITAEEKQLIEDAKINLYNSRFDITRTRGVLVVLATETISRSNSLIRVLQAILRKDVPVSKQAKGVTIVVNKMKLLLERSQTLLKDARVQYEEVMKKLNVVKVKLETFSKRVLELGDISGKRYTDYAKKMRITIYASAASCLVMPATCPAVYAACAAALETHLTKYRNQVMELTTKAKSSGAEANKLISNTAGDLKYMKDEDWVIGKWQLKVKSTYDDYQRGDYLQVAIDMDQFEEHYSINQLEDLKKAATEYLEHAANSRTF